MKDLLNSDISVKKKTNMCVETRRYLCWNRKIFVGQYNANSLVSSPHLPSYQLLPNARKENGSDKYVFASILFLVRKHMFGKIVQVFGQKKIGANNVKYFLWEKVLGQQAANTSELSYPRTWGPGIPGICIISPPKIVNYFRWEKILGQYVSNSWEPTPRLPSCQLVADAGKEKCENAMKENHFKSEDGREERSDAGELEELDLGSDFPPGSLFQLNFTRKRASVQELDENRDDVDGTTSALLRSDQVAPTSWLRSLCCPSSYLCSVCPLWHRLTVSPREPLAPSLIKPLSPAPWPPPYLGPRGGGEWGGGVGGRGDGGEGKRIEEGEGGILRRKGDKE